MPVIYKWKPYQDPAIETYRVYRSFIGFVGKVTSSLAGKTLQLRVGTSSNPGSIQNITFGPDYLRSLNQQLVGAKAWTGFTDGTFVFRPDNRSLDASIELVGGDALPLLDIGAPRVIDAMSESIAIADIPQQDEKLFEYCYYDHDGSLLDFYSIAPVIAGMEGSKSPFERVVDTGLDSCVIEGSLVNIHGSPLVDKLIKVSSPFNEYNINEEDWVGLAPSAFMSEHNGRFSFLAIRGTKIRVSIPSIGYEGVMKVPDQEFAFLSSLVHTDGHMLHDCIYT